MMTIVLIIDKWINFHLLSTEKTILLKYLKIELNIDFKVILLDHQNNYVERLNVDDAKTF